MSSVLVSRSPAFDPSLNPEERTIIEEEIGILGGLRDFLVRRVPEWRDVNYDEALLELRDSLNEATEDEVAQIVSQMSNLASLSTYQSRRDSGGTTAIDPESPYFAHLRVKQEGRTRDVLIGNRTLVSGDMPYPIIDWRHAPISRVFYCYQEGDDYEEEIGGRLVEGEILAHRRLLIVGGRLIRIDAPQGTFALADERWQRMEAPKPALEGGEGAALRPGVVEPLELGIGHPTIESDDKHLRAITGLIDSNQFDLITRSESGVVVIDGGAGSGKTTIALHRMAYLAYRDPERFAPQTMLAVVFSRALAAYISHLLPALGVQEVRIEVFDAFISSLRRQHFPNLICGYADSTPTAVMRFKQHPAAFALLEEFAAQRANELRESLAAALADVADREQVLAAWDALAGEPLAGRVSQFARWAAGKHIIAGVGRIGVEWLTAQRLLGHLAEEWPDTTHPHLLVQTLWEEGFLSLERLREGMQRLAPAEFSDEHLEEVRDRALRCYDELEEYRAWQSERREGAEYPGTGEDDGELAEPLVAPEPPRIDREDDTLLLLLYGHVVGPLRSRKRRPLRFQHVTVDEAQDLGPLELRVLIELAAAPPSVTLAGDTDQRMILHNSFTRWEEVLEHLRLPSTAISPLQVGYRSTEEIMHFAREVLGPLATERKWIPTRKGSAVELLRFTDTGQAVAMLADALRSLMRREPRASVALISRYPSQAEVYFRGLERAEVPTLRRVADQDFAFRPGIEVTDIGQVKGLEFDYVVLLDVDASTYPEDTASRYLLHIGATRAAHQLWLVSCRSPSPLLPRELRAHLL